MGEQAYVKFSKCDFWMREVSFLRHIISEHSVSVDPDKVRAVQEWRCPQTMRDIQSFLGLACYYHRFIRILCSGIPDNSVDQEGLAFQMDRGMLGQFPEIEEAANRDADSNTTRSDLALCDLYRCL